MRCYIVRVNTGSYGRRFILGYVRARHIVDAYAIAAAAQYQYRYELEVRRASVTNPKTPMLFELE